MKTGFSERCRPPPLRRPRSMVLLQEFTRRVPGQTSPRNSLHTFGRVAVLRSVVDRRLYGGYRAVARLVPVTTPGQTLARRASTRLGQCELQQLCLGARPAEGGCSRSDFFTIGSRWSFSATLGGFFPTCARMMSWWLTNPSAPGSMNCCALQVSHSISPITDGRSMSTRHSANGHEADKTYEVFAILVRRTSEAGHPVELSRASR